MECNICDGTVPLLYSEFHDTHARVFTSVMKFGGVYECFNVDPRVVSCCSPDFASVAFESNFGSCICVVNYDIYSFLPS